MRANPGWSGNAVSLKYEAAPVRIMLPRIDITPPAAMTCIQVSEILRSGFGPWEYTSPKMVRVLRNGSILSAMAQTKIIIPLLFLPFSEVFATRVLGLSVTPAVAVQLASYWGDEDNIGWLGVAGRQPKRRRDGDRSRGRKAAAAARHGDGVRTRWKRFGRGNSGTRRDAHGRARGLTEKEIEVENGDRTWRGKGLRRLGGIRAKLVGEPSRTWQRESNGEDSSGGGASRSTNSSEEGLRRRSVSSAKTDAMRMESTSSEDLHLAGLYR